MTPTRSAATIAALALVVLVAACGSPGAPSGGSGVPHPATLAGTAWRVVAVDGRAPIAGAEPTVVFAAERVSGSGGCNQYGGGYRYDGATGRLAFDQLSMTAMACLEEARNAFETAFFQALGQSTQAASDAQGELIISGPAGRIVLQLAGRPAPSG